MQISVENAREGGFLHGGMTVAAIDAQAADVVLVAERHRLLAQDAGTRDIIRPAEFRCHPSQAGKDEDRAQDAHLGDDVEAAVKNLRHECHLVPASIHSAPE